MKKVILTYGTFDMLHVGHVRLLKRLKDLGDFLIVGVSTDQFNEVKGKKTVIPHQDRLEIVASLNYVDLAIPENSWTQKIDDIKKYKVNVFGIGDDWKGEFDNLNKFCEVVYLPRTEGISSTQLKNTLKILDKEHVEEIKESLDKISSIVDMFT